MFPCKVPDLNYFGESSKVTRALKKVLHEGDQNVKEFNSQPIELINKKASLSEKKKKS